MSKGFFGGMFSSNEKEETASSKAGAEAFAAALAASVANQNPEVAAKTVAFFDKQIEVLEVQRKSLEAEHEFFEVEWAPRLLGIRLRVAFQVFVALSATVIGIGAAIAIFDAVHSRSVVIDPFEIAPNIASQVPSGRIVAAGLLDVLTQLQAATQTFAQKRQISDAWTDEITIEVPETGVSIGQIERVLKTRFGHDQHISGDLIKADPAGLTLAVRGAGVLPKTFSDEKGDLGSLLTKAAEYVYGESEPGLLAVYLADVNRNNDAITFAKSHFVKAGVDDKALLLAMWGAAIFAKGEAHAVAEALPLWKEAVRIKPDFGDGNYWVTFALNALGDEEGTVQFGLQMIKLGGGRPGKIPEEDYSAYDADLHNVLAARAAVLDETARNSGVGTNTYALGTEVLDIAALDAQLHEVDVARLRLKTTVWDPQSHVDVESEAYANALLAEEVEDFSGAAKYWDDVAVMYNDPVVASLEPPAMCLAATTYEKTGQHIKADAALDAPMKVLGIGTYVDCYRFRGDVLDLRGDGRGAQAWYAKAVKLAPSIPSGYYSWGLALAKHGDLAGAVAKLADANKRGPHWADPLKAWGDVLVKQGKTKEALVKYDEALKYAPNWKELKEAREAIAKQKG